MGFLKYLTESLNPFAAVLIAHINKLDNMDDVLKAADIIKNNFKDIDLEKLNEILQSFNFSLKSKNPNALQNLFNNLNKININY